MLTAPVRINDVKLIYHFEHLSHLVSRFWLYFDRSISLLECLRIETDWCFLTKGMLAVYELRESTNRFRNILHLGYCFRVLGQHVGILEL